MFDTHCHINFHSFKNNVKDVIRRASDAGVSHINIPGTDVKTSEDAVRIAEDFENIYASIGIHPHHIFKYQIGKTEETRNSKLDPVIRQVVLSNDQGEIRDNFINSELKKIENLIVNKKVVAVGEIGLDRHYYSKTKYEEYEISEKFMSLQKEVFVKQIDIAVKYKKSLVLHNREASDEFLEAFSDVWRDSFKQRSVFHCCEPNKKLLDFAKSHDIFIGVDGDVTYSKEKEEFVKEVPLELLVLETDSPFLTPKPERSEKKFPNEPKNLSYIAEFIANKLSLPLRELKKITFENSKKLFNLN